MALVNGRTSTIKIGADMFGDIMSIALASADKGQLSFTDLQSGTTKEFTATITVKVDMTTGGLWKFAYDQAVTGASTVLTWAPYGNAAASAGEPHLHMTGAFVDGKPDLSITANAKDKATADIVFQVDDYTVETT